MKCYPRYFKRLFDIFASSILLLTFSSFILMTFILIFIMDRTWPYFLRGRPGKSEKIFKLIKFKSKIDKHNGTSETNTIHSRITALGRVIRFTSIDKQPHLINVLRGEMRLIGPRPLLIEYLPLYTHEHRKTHLVRQGITGWDQVYGRNSSSWK